jgi:hypothetical protein
VIWTYYTLAKIKTDLHQTQSISVATNTLPSGSEIGHSGQRVGMLRAQHPLARLHYLHLQALGLLPPAQAPKRRYQVAHADQRVGMLRPQHPLFRLQYLHPMPFGRRAFGSTGRKISTSSTCTSWSSASFHRPWFSCVDARLPMLVSVSGCFAPSTLFRVSIT